QPTCRVRRRRRRRRVHPVAGGDRRRRTVRRRDLADHRTARRRRARGDRSRAPRQAGRQGGSQGADEAPYAPRQHTPGLTSRRPVDEITTVVAMKSTWGKVRTRWAAVGAAVAITLGG